MSILGQIPEIVLVIVALAVCPLIASAAGVFRLRSLNGPNRLPTPLAAPPLTFVACAGFLALIAVQAGYMSYVRASFASVHGGNAAMHDTDFRPIDWAVLSTIPALVAFAALVIGDRLIVDRLALPALGFTVRRFPAGLRAGAIGAAIVLPMVYVLAVLVNWVYDRVHYRHPAEHELLLAMKGSAGWVRIVLVLAATVITPLFEELLFRAHLQTLIRHALRWFHRTVLLPAGPAASAGMAAAERPPIESGRASAPVESAPVMQVEAGRPWQTLAAIVLTSLIFSAVHPTWTWPPIFFLSVGLGYAYERTGNLWAPITMHCVFNSLSTTIYFLQAH